MNIKCYRLTVRIAFASFLLVVGATAYIFGGPEPVDASVEERFRATVLTQDAPKKNMLSSEMKTQRLSLEQNDFILFWIAIATSTSPVTTPKVSGAGVEWKLETSVDVNGGPRRLFVYSGRAEKATTDSLAFSLGHQRPIRTMWAVIRYEGVKSVAQTVVAKDSTARDGAGEVVFKTAPNGPVAATVFGSIRTNIENHGPPELAEEYSSPFRFQTVYGVLPQKMLQWKWETGVHYLGLGVELEIESR